MKLLIHTVVFLCFLIALPSKANASFTQSIFFNALSIISEPLSITVQNKRNKKHNETFFYLRNQPFSMYALCNAEGKVVERISYTPYGKQTILKPDYTRKKRQVPRQDFGYTGRRLDNESNLCHFRARYFDSDLGRFISRDPIGYVDGMNLYRGYFVPNGIDPSGLDVYELQRDADLDWDLGIADHKYVFIDDTGLKDEKGRNINYTIDDTDAGRKVTPTTQSLEDHMKTGEVKDPDLRKVDETKTTSDESKYIIDGMKKSIKDYEYDYPWQDCGESIDDAKECLKKCRNAK